MIICLGRIQAVIAFACVAFLGSGAGASAATVTYVSMAGDSNNDCLTPATACRSVSSAISAVEANGTVIIQGPYESDSPQISKSINIVGQGSVVLRTIFLGFNVPYVRLKNIMFNTQTSTATAIVVNTATKVNITDCSFFNYTDAAVFVKGPAGARVALERVGMSGNKYGVVAEGTAGAANTVFIEDTKIDASTASAVEVRGSANVAVLIGSTLSGSALVDLSLLNGGRAISYRNNVIRSGTPTQTLPLN